MFISDTEAQRSQRKSRANEGEARLNEAIQGGPIRVTMNTGRTYEIPSRDHAIVDSIAAHVLTKDADGKFRTRILALVCMVSIEKLAAAA